MHAAQWAWRRARRAFAKCGGYDMREGCGPGGRSWGDHGEEGHEGGGFGIRRPLRFLAYKLGLDEGQVAALARVLDELKTERAQAEVDRRRTVAAFAERCMDRILERDFPKGHAAHGQGHGHGPSNP